MEKSYIVLLSFKALYAETLLTYEEFARMFDRKLYLQVHGVAGQIL